MVNLGYIPQERKIPAPDLSYMRLFEDGETGWQYRGQYAIWMKNMKFPIDIIWMRDNTVVGFAENAQPELSGEALKLYQPPGFVNYVLEVSAGTVERLNISPGTEVVIQ